MDLINLFIAAFTFGSIAIFLRLSITIFNYFLYSKILEKAGKVSWIGYVPIYNIVELAKISKLNAVWIIFIVLRIFLELVELSPLLQLAINCLALISLILLNIKLAKAFDLSILFAIGMILFPTIFYAILAFGPFYYILKKDNSIDAFALNNNHSKDYEPQSDFFKD